VRDAKRSRPNTSTTVADRLLTKLAARDRAQLVRIADETGVTLPGLS
jgi:hypothetical protein